MSSTLRIDVSVRYVYKCSGCRLSELGTTQRFSSNDLSDVQLKLKYPTPHGMPRGWASYAGNVFRCSECKI